MILPRPMLSMVHLVVFDDSSAVNIFCHLSKKIMSPSVPVASVSRFISISTRTAWNWVSADLPNSYWLFEGHFHRNRMWWLLSTPSDMPYCHCWAWPMSFGGSKVQLFLDILPEYVHTWDVYKRCSMTSTKPPEHLFYNKYSPTSTIMQFSFISLFASVVTLATLANAAPNGNIVIVSFPRSQCHLVPTHCYS